jgi:hypothetical protein
MMRLLREGTVLLILVLSLSSGISIPNYPPQSTRVGPVYLFEPISQIRQTLGPVIYTIRCDEPWACVDSLTYTDGQNTIQFYSGNEKGGQFRANLIKITFGYVMRGASRINPKVECATRWTWANTWASSLPTDVVDGWKTDPGSSIPHDAIYTKTVCFQPDQNSCGLVSVSKNVDKNHRRVFGMSAD